MADDVNIRPSAATDAAPVAADELSTLNGTNTTPVNGRKPVAQRVKIVHGDDGDGTDASAAHPLPTTMVGVATDAKLEQARALLATSATAANQATAKAVLDALHLATQQDRHFPRGELLFDDWFARDHSYFDWQEIVSGNPTPPISLSHSGLKLSTGPYVSSTVSGAAAAIKRMQRVSETGLLHFEAWMGYGADDLTQNPRLVYLGIDTQLHGATDNSGRAFPTLRYTRFDASPVAVRNQLELIPDSTNAAPLIEVPGSNVEWGPNENKAGHYYMRLTVDLAQVAAYHEAQLGSYVYDLSGLGAGAGHRAPQLTSSFSGGLNFLLHTQNAGTNAGRSYLWVSRARAWIEGAA